MAQRSSQLDWLRLFGCLATAMLGCLVALGAPAVAGADELADARVALYKRYAEQLGKLADWCEQQGLASAAQATRAWLPPHEPNTITLFVLPDVADWDSPGGFKDASGDSGKLTEWRTRFRQMREEQAEALFAFARQAVGERRGSLTHELILEVAHENPDHKKARKLLGYVHTPERWQRPYAVQQASLGRVRHPQFGWLPKNQVARYERGQRFFRNRWVSADEDRQLHSDIRNGWQVETAHYLVTTNHSLEEGVRLADRLERFYGFWQTLFAGYVVGDAELIRRFEGRSLTAREVRKHNVVYYRNRDEYNAALRAAQPQIDITLGIYFDSVQTAYFFAGQGQQSGTFYHEATHQLFHETRSVAKDVGGASNFWIVEGVACYMESLAEQEGGYFRLGGANGGRLPAARQRRLVDNFYVPLAKLASFGMEDLQRDPDIAKLYSQSAGLTTFLMHYDSGRYREALVAYLESVYSGRANGQTLAEATGAKYEALDQQYRQFLEE